MKIFIASLALLSSAGLLACNASQVARPTTPAEQKRDRPTPAAKESPTIEDLLRWPLEGRSGTDRLIAALHRTFEMKRIRDAQYSGDGPLKLIDGHTLSFADTLEKSPFVDIGIDEAKCVDPQWAAGLIEAELSPVYQDAHGVDRGRSYHARRNGMFLRFNTTPVTYRCVTSLHVSPEPEQRSSSEPTPPLALKKSALTFEDLLLWPLEGKQSSTRLIEALERSYQMKALRESQFSGEGPLRLSDGRVLSFAYIRKLSGNIDIGVDEKPCVDPEQIAKLTRASLDPAYQDAHGVDQGRVYNAARNGMSVRFNTTPTTYRCVTAIHIRPTP